LKSLYSKDFAVFEANAPRSYPEGHELRKITSLPYTPVFVFLDAKGKKVAETHGFRTPREGRALHEFVSKKHYAKTTWPKFLGAYPGK
jgi:thioredoxin-related protein